MITSRGFVGNTPLPRTDSVSFTDSAAAASQHQHQQQQQASQNSLATVTAASPPPSASLGPNNNSSPSSPHSLPAISSMTPLSTVSPADFDIVPALHQLLSRLLPATPPTLSSSSMAPPYHHHQSHSYTGATPLDIPGLTPATSGLMVKLQHARAAIRALPDIDRTVNEQMMEISFLQERVEKLKGLLKSIREECFVEKGEIGAGAGAGAEDDMEVKMVEE